MSWSYFTNQIPELVDHLVVELPWSEIQIQNSVASRSGVLDAWNGWDLHKNPKNHLHLKVFGQFCLHSFVTDTPKSCKKKTHLPETSQVIETFHFEWSRIETLPGLVVCSLVGFIQKKMGLSDISPNESERSYGCESPKSPKRWSKFDLTKYRLSSREPPRKRKDLANKIHPVFFHTDLHLRFYLQLWKIT